MKRFFLLLIPALFLFSCSKETTVELVSFTDTGCDKSTISPATKAGSDSQLILAFSKLGLVITRTNAMMNCSMNKEGLLCDVSCEGSSINYHVYEKAEPVMKCTCPVAEMSSTIAGLRTGTEYTLYYTCGDTSFMPISFTYQKGLNLVLDADLYILPPTPEI